MFRFANGKTMSLLILVGIALLPVTPANGDERSGPDWLSQVAQSPPRESDPDEYRPPGPPSERYPEDRTRPPSTADPWDDRRPPRYDDDRDRLRSADCESDEFKCPRSRRINCMPPVRGNARALCAPKYLNWVRRHCPDVEVVH